MKREVQTITHRQWKKAIEVGNEAMASIPESHTRVREHAKSDAIWEFLQKHVKTIEIGATGRECVHWYNENLGNRKWADYVRAFQAGKILKVYASTFATDMSCGRVANLIVLYR